MGAKKVDDGTLNVSEFARLMGCSHTAVQKAIKKGKIVKGYNKETKRINVDEARVEWEEELKEGVKMKKKESLSAGGRGDAAQASPGEVPALQPPPAPSRNNRDRPKKRREDAAEGEEEEGWDGTKWNGGEVPKHIDYKEALRIGVILKAENDRIKNDELLGLLVRKTDIEGQLMVAGMEIRKMFERFPAGIVDGVIAAKDRGEALRVMDKGVREFLELLNDSIAQLFN